MTSQAPLIGSIRRLKHERFKMAEAPSIPDGVIVRVITLFYDGHNGRLYEVADAFVYALDRKGATRFWALPSELEPVT